MTEETQRLDFEEYAYAALAQHLRSSEDEGTRSLAKGALEVLAGPKGFNLGEKGEGFVRGAIASEKGIQTAINTYNPVFEEKRGNLKPSQLVNWYNPVFEGLEDDEQGKFVRELNRHDEPIKDIMKALNTASYRLKAPKGEYTNEQLDAARQTIKKYEDTITVMHVLDEYKFETMRIDAVDSDRLRTLKGLASKL